MTEGEFNAWLSGQFKKMKPEVLAVKVSDKYQVGISDFLVWTCGGSVAIECKVAKAMLGAGDLLSHPFSGPQCTFLANMKRAGSIGYGLVYVEGTHLMYLIPPESIKSNGNVTADILVSQGFVFGKRPDGARNLVNHLAGAICAKQQYSR